MEKGWFIALFTMINSVIFPLHAFSIMIVIAVHQVTNSKTWNGYGICNELMRISRQTLSYQVLEASLCHLYRPSCHHVNFRLSSLSTTRLLTSFTVFFLFICYLKIATKYCWFSENRLIENPIRNPLGNSSAIQLNEMSPSVGARFRPVFISKV